MPEEEPPEEDEEELEEEEEEDPLMLPEEELPVIPPELVVVEPPEEEELLEAIEEQAPFKQLLQGIMFVVGDDPLHPNSISLQFMPEHCETGLHASAPRQQVSGVFGCQPKLFVVIEPAN